MSRFQNVLNVSAVLRDKQDVHSTNILEKRRIELLYFNTGVSLRQAEVAKKSFLKIKKDYFVTVRKAAKICKITEVQINHLCDIQAINFNDSLKKKDKVFRRLLLSDVTVLALQLER